MILTVYFSHRIKPTWLLCEFLISSVGQLIFYGFFSASHAFFSDIFFFICQSKNIYLNSDQQNLFIFLREFCYFCALFFSLFFLLDSTYCFRMLPQYSSILLATLHLNECFWFSIRKTWRKNSIYVRNHTEKLRSFNKFSCLSCVGQKLQPTFLCL